MVDEGLDAGDVLFLASQQQVLLPPTHLQEGDIQVAGVEVARSLLQLVDGAAEGPLEPAIFVQPLDLPGLGDIQKALLIGPSQLVQGLARLSQLGIGGQLPGQSQQELGLLLHPADIRLPAMEQKVALRQARLVEMGLDGKGLVDPRHEAEVELGVVPDQGVLAPMVLPDSRQVEEAHQGKAESDLLADAQLADDSVHTSPLGCFSGLGTEATLVRLNER